MKATSYPVPAVGDTVYMLPLGIKYLATVIEVDATGQGKPIIRAEGSMSHGSRWEYAYATTRAEAIADLETQVNYLELVIANLKREEAAPLLDGGENL